jgi:hypothetical protein
MDKSNKRNNPSLYVTEPKPGIIDKLLHTAYYGQKWIKAYLDTKPERFMIIRNNYLIKLIILSSLLINSLAMATIRFNYYNDSPALRLPQYRYDIMVEGFAVNGVHSGSTGSGWSQRVPAGLSKQETTYATIFAPRPAGKYEIYAACSGWEMLSEGGSRYMYSPASPKQTIYVEDGSTVTIRVFCPIGATYANGADMLLLPIVNIQVEK